MSEQTRMGSTVLSRRAAVRGAVWSIPAVTVATTAPAFAINSGALTVTDLVVTYLSGTPERAEVSATVTGFTDDYLLTLTVPAGVFDSVDSESASGGASTGLAASHTLVFASTSSSFHATLELGSRSVTPWLGFHGPAFTVSAVAGADGRQSQSQTAAVMAYAMPNAVLNTDPNPTARRQRLFVDSIAVHHDYPGVIGKIVLVVAIPKVVGEAKPGTGLIHSAWVESDEITDGANHWNYRFTTAQEHHTARTGPQAGNADRGPAPHAAGGAYYEFWVDMQDMPEDVVDETAVFYLSAEGDTEARLTYSRTIKA